jgi:hypothetical protein
MSAARRSPVPELIWHPEQKLWNRSLMAALRRRLGGGPFARFAVAALLLIDSLLMWARVRIRAPRRPGGRELAAGRPKVLYVDCGVHKQGEQIRWMHTWFGDRYDLQILGFEASAEHCRDAAVALADIPGLKLFNVALVGPDYEGDEVRLYTGSLGEGKGDSLFAGERAEYEVVPARRLSAVMREECPALAEVPIVLRMNIEGAEYMVIDDLIEAGMDGLVDGYYGMWDDVSKTNPKGAEAFRELLRSHHIEHLTFNDRDLATDEVGARPHGPLGAMRALSFGLRRSAIRADIAAAIGSGLAGKTGRPGQRAAAASADGAGAAAASDGHATAPPSQASASE